MSDRYVQSKYSKDAPLWKVMLELDDSWNCSTESVAYLPKSEYVEVPAPERWEDVTAQCVIDDYENRVGAFWSIIHAADGNGNGPNVMAKLNEGYRIRKVNIETRLSMETAFIIERKVNP